MPGLEVIEAHAAAAFRVKIQLHERLCGESAQVGAQLLTVEQSLKSELECQEQRLTSKLRKQLDQAEATERRMCNIEDMLTRLSTNLGSDTPGQRQRLTSRTH